VLDDSPPHITQEGWLVQAGIPIVVFLGAFVMMLGRLTVPGHGLSWAGTYEALAHIWVGIVIAGAAYDKSYRWAYLFTLAVLTLFEAVMFFTRPGA
jgi:hypothetical protein